MNRQHLPGLLARFTSIALMVNALAGCGASGSSSSSEAASSRPVLPDTSASANPSASPSSVLPTPWTSATGTAAQQDAATAAMASYNGMWQDLIAVSAISDFMAPRLMAHMLDQPLTDWAQQFATEKRKGIVASGRPVWDPEVVSVSPSGKPDRVEIADCIDSTNWLQVYAATGKPVNNVPGGRHRSEAVATIDPVTGSWLVTQQVYGKVGSC